MLDMLKSSPIAAVMCDKDVNNANMYLLNDVCISCFTIVERDKYSGIQCNRTIIS